jgi:cyclopropane-fatty-acyl-phospholipid synthase
MKEWAKAVKKPSFKKLLFLLSLVPRYITNQDFRYQLASNRYGCNRVAFERNIFSHQRMVFERKP